MPQILMTIDQYVACERKKDTIFMVFNTIYNDFHAFNKKLSEEDRHNYLNEDFTDQDARKEFEDFMKNNFPSTDIIQAFDLVSSSWSQWPYLGSYIIDTEIDGDAYNALVEKYEDKDGNPLSNNAVLFIIDLETAQKLYKEREETIEAEFGEDF